jgi:hypothetical protein
VSPCLILHFRFSDDTVVEVVTDNKLSKEYDCSEKYEIGALVRTYSSSLNRCASHHSRELFDHTTVGTHQALSYCHKKSLPHSLQKNPCIAVSLAWLARLVVCFPRVMVRIGTRNLHRRR